LVRELLQPQPCSVVRPRLDAYARHEQERAVAEHEAHVLGHAEAAQSRATAPTCQPVPCGRFTHKRQGSELAAIIPLCTQHYTMLFRDLV